MMTSPAIGMVAPFLGLTMASFLPDASLGYIPPTKGLLGKYPRVAMNKDIVVGFEDMYPAMERRIRARYAKREIPHNSTRPYLEDIIRDVDKLLAMDEFTQQKMDDRSYKLTHAHVSQAAKLRDTIQSKMRVFIFDICQIDSMVESGRRYPINPKTQAGYMLVMNYLDIPPKNIDAAVGDQTMRRGVYVPPGPKPAPAFTHTVNNDTRTIVLNR